MQHRFSDSLGMGFVRTLEVVLVSLFAASAAHAQTRDQADFFETEIRPILATKCSGCHGEKVRMASLRLTSPEGVLKGADSGPIIVKGDPESSRLVQVVSYQGSIKMPPTGKLSDKEIAAIGAWVKMGAPWPRPIASGIASVAGESGNEIRSARTDHWAFQPIQDFNPPQVSGSAWIRTPVDSFILATLEKNDLRPAPRADKLTLLRRAKFDLHGLPPARDEIEGFLSDSDPGAFARLVSRLLSSPRYGERWGRHWLDVARYADPNLHAWRYRDYVIDALNRDLPYDRFVQDQIAGDLLAAGKADEPAARRIIATGFLALGPKSTGERDKVKMLYDVVDEQITTVSRAFLALTIGCARCHDHKFDPISARDYYSLASIFASTKTFETIQPQTRLYYQRLVAEDVFLRYQSHSDKVKAKQAQIESILEAGVAEYKAERLHPRLADYMMAVRRIRLEGAPLAGTARVANLDAGILQRWVDYLRPGFRPFLQNWYRSYALTDVSQVRAIAEEYQKEFQQAAREWREDLRSWTAAVEAAVRTQAAAPRRPSFEAFKDRFFAEVDLPSGSYEESIANGPFTSPRAAREEYVPGTDRERLADLRTELQQLERASPLQPAMAAAVGEGAPVEQAIFVRGSHQNRGEVVPKQFPVVLAGRNQAPVTHGSGRKELAEWLAEPHHPLTSRVMANRIWNWHFREGLVRTPDNFGISGEIPTHPELLDYLASRLVQSDWSVKEMHRLIMLSSAYQMSSRGSRYALEEDPENRLWSRFNRRRLTVEEMRDSFLALGQSLDLAVGGQVHDPVLTATEENERANSRIRAADYRRRTIYLPLHRHKLPSLLTLFDFGDASQSSGQRFQSDIAPQALYLLNSQFVHEQSHALAAYLLAGEDRDGSNRVEQAYLMALTREPTLEELRSGLDFIKDHPAKQPNDSGQSLAAWQSFCKMLMISNEFHYVN